MLNDCLFEQNHRFFESQRSVQEPSAGVTAYDDDHLLSRFRLYAGRVIGALLVIFFLLGCNTSLSAQASCNITSGNYNPCNYDTANIIQEMIHPHANLVMLAAHRGVHNTINPFIVDTYLAPENSLESIGDGAQLGFEMAEVDIKMSADNVPMLSHDTTWGREALCPTCSTAGGDSFDPFGAVTPANQALNPPVASLTEAQAKTYKLWTVQNPSAHTDPVASLQDLLTYMTTNKIAMVIALDLKDINAAVACWTVIKANTDYLGRPYYKSIVFKMGGQVFGATPTLFENTFGSDYPNVLYWPYYTTNMIAPIGNNFGSEANMITSLRSWQASGVQLVGSEVNIKEPGGILTQMLAAAKTYNDSYTTSVGSFSPTAEYLAPRDTNPRFFYGKDSAPKVSPPTYSGYCCYTLQDILYNGSGNGQDSDTTDDRGNINFLVQSGISVITTDEVTSYDQTLREQNLRHTEWLQDNFQGNPHCNPLNPQYPGCNDPNDPGTTVYTYCAAEGGACSFTGQRVVAYGANGLYNYSTVNNNIACNNSTLGPDPDPGAAKACYYSPAIWDPGPAPPFLPIGPQGVYCADENGVCNFNGSANGVFALGFQSVSISVQNSFNCNSSTFGNSDPHPGLVKTCFYQLPNNFNGAPAGYVLCANEGQTCTFAGAARIAFGVNGNFNYRTFTTSSSESSAGGAPCNVSEFSDPDIGVGKACYYQYVKFVTSNVGGGSGTSTCDIYASGGTPCVAAHSTVRALFGAYNGRLYQVKRSSDNTSMDIDTLTAGGYANAAAQDSFCAGTGVTCTITMIYDQTSNHNDMPIEGAGGSASPGADSGAVANALPIQMGSNRNPVYGVSVTQGVGYRNNATTGVAKGNAPEGMYMVTSGTNFNNQCCFDYGNAEESMHDDGKGAMDALNFGSACILNESSPCNGSGPWVEVDLENGQWMGSGSNPGDVSMGYDFVTAMHKNNGTTTFALKGGNAQSGGLTTDYSGSLPSDYIQKMNLQGAIVLGTGGDNSNTGIGSFFEGAITSGYPTDSTEDAVQANIVTAGYNGNSGGSSGDNGSTYTGPSDPNGPGPQDGFGSPAVEQANDVLGSKPALASFEGSLYLAFMGLNAGNNLFVASSSDGVNFPFATMYGNIKLGSAPALASFNGSLYVAFLGLNAGNNLFVTSSASGSGFPTATMYSNIKMAGAPAMSVFNNQLCLSFRGLNVNNTLYVTCSSDGVNWPNGVAVPNVQMGSDPAMVGFNGKLYVAFKSNNPSNSLWIASSSDGVNFTSQLLPNVSMGGNSSPALVASNGVLYYIYGANDGGNEMLVMASTDGSTWQGPAAYLGVQMGAAGPAAAAFGVGVSVGFQSNDPRQVLYMTGKITEASTYTGPSDPGGAGPQDGFGSPAIEQPNDVLGSRPALASFDGDLYLAFMGYNAGNNLFVAASSGGVNFPVATMQPNIQLGSAPALASFNGSLYLAFLGYNAGNNLFVTSSSDGVNWPTATMQANIQMAGAPALAVFNNQLCLSFRGYNVDNTLFVTCSPDGVNWPTAVEVPNVQMGSDPTMAVFNGRLYIGFKSNDANNGVWIASSSDAIHFTSQVLPNISMGWESTPALVASNGVLYYIYGANDYANEMMVMASGDGSTWQGPAAYGGVQMGVAGLGAAAFGDGVAVDFQSNDGRQVLYTTNKVTEASTYTGPSDPNGAGPQDGFASPASEEPNDIMGSKPALASYNGSVYVAFMGLNAGNNLFITSSSSGSNFPTATMFPNIKLGSAPALASFNGSLYLAFMGYNAGNNLFVTAASGFGFPAATIEPNIQMAGAPAMAVFNNQLCLSFRGLPASNTLYVTCSSDGVTWPTAWAVPNVQMGSDPAMATYNGKLYVAFKSNDANNGVWIASSSDGHTFTSQVLPNLSMGGNSAPALAVGQNTLTGGPGNALYYIYGADDLGNEMMVMASTDGSTWTGPAAFPGIQMGATGPGATTFDNGVSVGFQSNDSRNVLYTTFSSVSQLPTGPSQ